MAKGTVQGRGHGHGNEASASTTTSPRFDDVAHVYSAVDEVMLDERVPLLSGSIAVDSGDDGHAAGQDREEGEERGHNGKGKKPFYRARPLWLVPFALAASVSRGMTLAPRVEVFTQLSCDQIYGDHLPSTIPNFLSNSTAFNPTLATNLLHLAPLSPDSPPVSSPLSIVGGSQMLAPDDTYNPNDSASKPLSVPSQRCSSDPLVQASAARLQMIMTTTMGLLSALTTGWWGYFGEQHGRMKVLAGATFGRFMMDLTFILISTPNSPLSKNGHILLLIASIVEGSLGGWATLEATTSAYVSDCTSSGSRAHIFSMFTGVINLGVFLGPTISGYLIQRSHMISGEKNVTGVFWVAVTCSFLNFLAAAFVVPESIDGEKRRMAKEECDRARVRMQENGKGKTRVAGDVEDGERREDVEKAKEGFIARLISPLAVFLPVMVRDHGSGRMRRDWSLTRVAIGFFGFMLYGGLSQLKYFYSEHVYGWGAEELSWYISFIGGTRAITLLLVLPYVISLFKPKPTESTSSHELIGKGKNNGKGISTGVGAPQADGKKAKPTRSQLRREISFDLALTRCSFLMDLVSNLLILASPAPPAPTFHHTSLGPESSGMGAGQSQVLYVLASSISSFGTGSGPAVNSLALCILQAREMGEETSDGESVSSSGGTRSVGELFGAFAFLQSIGSMILGPMMFGIVYSSTVAVVPKAIFMVSSGLLSVSLLLMLLVRNPVRKDISRRQQRPAMAERGRSRVSKDLCGGAVGYGTAGYGDV